VRKIGDHAVVLGAGMAGLLAARVVADAYQRVTVVERDPLPEAAESRRGVPQGRHAHNLYPPGAQIIGELFPGLLDELEAGGSPVVRDFAELRFSGRSSSLPQGPTRGARRSGRTPAWLATLGYDQPPEEQLTIGVKYASRHLRLRPGALGGEKFIVIGAEPGRPTGFVLFAQEEDRWILTLVGYDAHHPPTDPEGFVAFVETVAPPDVFAIRDAEPLDDIVAYRFPANLRRHYERLRRFPAGLLVFGDAICTSNPVYALGMSVAALQAVALRDSLTSGDRNLAGRFFRAASKPINMAWQLAVGADLALPYVRGPRPLPVRVINAYVDQVLTAAERDPTVAEQFIRVATLQHPPTRLFRPSTALRVLLGNLRRSRMPAIDAATRVEATGPSALEEKA
jgi:2-polyprenyl-6-methoxyphenol hydroxylase-like FAD-dependent oxidoreductase